MILGRRDLVALVREGRAAPSHQGPIVVSGPRAAEVADALAEGGRAGLVAVSEDARGAGALIRVLDGAITAADEAAVRAAARSGSAIVVLERDVTGPVPYVLATSRVSWPARDAVPLRELAEALARELRDDVVPYSAALPALRDAAVRGLGRDAAVTAAALALLRSGEGPVAPALTLVQARMLRRVQLARGIEPPQRPEGLAAVVGPEVVGATAVGVACRSLVRRLPVRSRLLDAAVAYGGTAVLAAAAGLVLRHR